MRNPSDLLAACAATWALDARVALALRDDILDTLRGGAPSRAALLAAAGRPRADVSRRARGSGIALVPVHGILVARAGWLAELFGATPHERVLAALEEADADPRVGTVLLDVNSPGGTVAGTPELAARVRTMRKPVVAHVNHTAASAAYWVASQADEVVVTPSGEVGSIGVLQMHRDVSKAAELEGVKVSFITAGRFKAEGNQFEPLGDEARAAAQRLVNDAHSQFVADVAVGRAARVDVVRGPRYGEGRMLSAADALAAGMIDRIEPIDATLARLGVGGAPQKRVRVAAPRRAGRSAIGPDDLAALQAELELGL